MAPGSTDAASVLTVASSVVAVPTDDVAAAADAPADDTASGVAASSRPVDDIATDSFTPDCDDVAMLDSPTELLPPPTAAAAAPLCPLPAADRRLTQPDNNRYFTGS